MRPAVSRPLDPLRGGEDHAVEEIMHLVTPSSVLGFCGPGKASCLNAYARRTADHFGLYSLAKKIQPQLRAQQRRNLLNESHLQITSDRDIEKKRSIKG